MKQEIEIITPKEAIYILENHNPKNRPVSENTVQSYALDMKNKQWTLTHQGIAFDVNGNLIDGQHRLWACVFSNVPLKTMVFRDLPIELDGLMTMDAIDRNRSRTTGVQMSLCHNIKNGNKVAAALRAIAIMITGNHGKLSTASSLQMYNIYGRDVESVLKACSTNQSCLAHVTGPLSMYHHGEPDKSIEFATEYSTFTNMHSSVAAAKRYFELHKRVDIAAGCRVMSNSIMSYHNGKIVKKAYDAETGIEFLKGMYPSLTKKIKDMLAPVRVSITHTKPLNQ